MPKRPDEQRGRSRSESSEPSQAWVDREISGCEFPDERLGKRFRSLLERLSSSPGDSIPLVCQDWANTKAAYRFLDNDRVSEAVILQGHFHATRGRASAEAGPILVFEYIEGWYYPHRRHSALGYRSPVNFERAHQRKAV